MIRLTYEEETDLGMIQQSMKVHLIFKLYIFRHLIYSSLPEKRKIYLKFFQNSL
jgi:hypothetical protein